jgi:hypothetical protein
MPEKTVDQESKSLLSESNIKKIAWIATLIETEDKIAATMKDFDDTIEGITISDVTRDIRKNHPEILKFIRHFIDLKNNKFLPPME